MTFIATIGIPGAGKSSFVEAVKNKHPRIHTFIEPPEAEWPEAARSRELCGFFTSANAMRIVRVPQLFKAQKVSQNGGTAVIDAYYDKLMHLFLGSDGLDWFMPPNDSYYPVAKLMAETDYKELPDADAVIGLKVDEELWRNFIAKRGRELDQSQSFTNSFAMQNAFLNAAKQYCSERNIPYIEIQQEDTSPQDTADRVLQLLEEKGIQL